MRHYSIWLEKYGKSRDIILGNLQGYKKEIDSVRAGIGDKNLVLPIDSDPGETRASMCFVDGGEGMKELLGASIYFIRASALVLDKTGETVGEKFVRDLDMGILEHDDYTKERVDFLRSIMEYDVAERCIEEHSPEYVFLDGSLYVNFKKRPVDCDEYMLARKKFTRLLKLAKNKGTHLCGVSEDSRSRLFIQYLASKYKMRFPRFMTDASLLRMLARNTRYRTIEFSPNAKFESNGDANSTLSVSFPTIYLQPTEVSNPLRIDVPDWEKDFNRIIRLIMQLSHGSKQFGYPMPLYLAHLDSHIEQKHADWSTTQLIHYLSKNDPELYETILRERRHAFRP